MGDIESSWLRLALRAANARALALQLGQDDRPRWRELATARAVLGLIGDPRIPRFAGAALDALYGKSSLRDRLRFAWAWWFEGATHFLHAYQAERLTPAWCAAHVTGTPRLPEGGAVLVSVHHFNHRLAWVRFSSMVDCLGVVSFFGLDDALRADRQHARSIPDAQTAQRQLATLYQRTFGDRVYPPRNAARAGLRLLEQGGYLIVMPDAYWRPAPGSILGRKHALGPGALWLAERAGRPIVPFSLIPQGTGWRLWCGQPVLPATANIDALLEQCIRRAPSNWALWPDWFRAPPAHAG